MFRKKLGLFWFTLVLTIIFFIPIKSLAANNGSCGCNAETGEISPGTNSCTTNSEATPDLLSYPGSCVCTCETSSSSSSSSNSSNTGSITYSGLYPKTNNNNFAFENANIGTIISKLLPYVYVVAGLILLLLLISGGIGLMTSGGNPDKTKAAMGKIQAGLIGFLIIFLAWSIAKIVEVLLGVSFM